MGLTVAALAAAVLSVGCRSPDDEFAPAFHPRVYAFEGSVEPKYVGTWRSLDGDSTLNLAKDGVLRIEVVSRSVAGRIVKHYSGQWLADGDGVRFRYRAGAQPDKVLKYRASLAGATMTLKQPEGHGKTTYKRQ